eukprot:XP_001697463.1 predicted protein [Chlamydomonas reinhardtii]
MREHLQALQAQGQGLIASVLQRIPPDLRAKAADAANKAYDQAAPLIANAYTVAEPHAVRAGEALARARQQFNASVADVDAATLVVATVLALLAVGLFLRVLRRLARPFIERGVLPVLFDAIRSLPPLSGIIAKEKAKMRQKLLSARDTGVPGGGPRDTLTRLPARGTPVEELGADGESRLSGAVYMAAHSPHRRLLDSTVAAFSLTNPLHADSFPSVRQMEAEAAEYFNIKLHVVPVGSDFRLRAADVRPRLNANTVLLVASAPGFPHGLVDDVQGIAGLAARAGICCHVDACLGGFCLPFVRQLGSRVPPFDFAVRGVTSMSVDTHKFGMAHKGTSVVLYRHPELRQHQFTRITDWSGGLYISPGLAGSRNGALIASACDELVRGISSHVPELEVIGEPEMGVNPPALHFCFTYMNSAVAPQLDGSAPLYGMSNVSPDRGMIGEFLVAYQDVMLMP